MHFTICSLFKMLHLNISGKTVIIFSVKKLQVCCVDHCRLPPLLIQGSCAQRLVVTITHSSWVLYIITTHSCVVVTFKLLWLLWLHYWINHHFLRGWGVFFERIKITRSIIIIHFVKTFHFLYWKTEPCTAKPSLFVTYAVKASLRLTKRNRAGSQTSPAPWHASTHDWSSSETSSRRALRGGHEGT